MSAIREINDAVRGLCKKAQAPGFTPTPLYFSSTMPEATRKEVQDKWGLGGEYDDTMRSGDAKALRGIARGIKEVVPDMVDTFTGGASGLINGGIHAMLGGKFSTGWKDSRDFVKKQMSDRIRNAEMAAGGNQIKKQLDDAYSMYMDRLTPRLGPGLDDRKKRLESIEDDFKNVSEFMAGFPVGGLAFAKGVTPALGASKMIGKWMGPAAKTVNRAAGTVDAVSATTPLYLDSFSDRDIAMDKLKEQYPYASEEVKKEILDRFPEASNW